MSTPPDPDPAGDTAMLRAVCERLRRGEPVAPMISAAPWMARCHDRHGNTMLHMAARLGRPEAVSALTAHGASAASVALSGDRAVPVDAPEFIRAAVRVPRGGMLVML